MRGVAEEDVLLEPAGLQSEMLMFGGFIRRCFREAETAEPESLLRLSEEDSDVRAECSSLGPFRFRPPPLDSLGFSESHCLEQSTGLS